MIQNSIIRPTQNYFLFSEIVFFYSKVKSPFISEKQHLVNAIILTQTIILGIFHQMLMEE
jgi:hypothetical protein